MPTPITMTICDVAASDIKVRTQRYTGDTQPHLETITVVTLGNLNLHIAGDTQLEQVQELLAISVALSGAAHDIAERHAYEASVTA